MRTLEHKIPPPAVVAFTGATMVFINWLAPHPRWQSGWHFAFGIAVTLAGFLILALGFRALRSAQTTVDPVNPERASALVSGGIYRFSRNPMYLGFAVMLVGWAVFLGSAWAFVGPIAFVAFITRFQIVPEERAMNANFGRDFAEFCKCVRRWI